MSDYFGQIPHAELLRSVARRVSDGRLLGWVKAWLEMAVEEDDGRGGRRRTNRARRERKGTPQGAPISPLFSNIYMRRFILGWKVLGYARRFKAEIVNYADDFAVLGRAPAEEMLASVTGLLKRLKLPMNAEKTRCCPQWTGQNRPFMDTSKPAISGGPRLELRSTSRRPLLARCLPAR